MALDRIVAVASAAVMLALAAMYPKAVFAAAGWSQHIEVVAYFLAALAIAAILAGAFQKSPPTWLALAIFPALALPTFTVAVHSIAAIRAQALSPLLSGPEWAAAFCCATFAGTLTSADNRRVVALMCGAMLVSVFSLAYQFTVLRHDF